MKNYYIIFLFFLIVCCKSKGDENVLDYFGFEDEQQIIKLDEALSESIFIDSIDNNILEAILPKKGYLLVDYARNLKISLLTNSLYLTDNSNFNYYGNTGLAYVWGGKNHTEKVIPTFYKKNGKRKPNECQEKIYGLDCSGFIYQIFLMSGFKFSTIKTDNPVLFADANFLSNPKNWIRPNKQYCDGSEGLIIKRINKPSFNNIDTGDILFFYNSINQTKHIGICLKYKNKIIFFDSGGGYASQSCEKAIQKGPRRIKLTPWLLKKWKGKTHGIIKISNAY